MFVHLFLYFHTVLFIKLYGNKPPREVCFLGKAITGFFNVKARWSSMHLDCCYLSSVLEGKNQTLELHLIKQETLLCIMFKLRNLLLWMFVPAVVIKHSPRSFQHDAKSNLKEQHRKLNSTFNQIGENIDTDYRRGVLQK